MKRTMMRTTLPRVSSLWIFALVSFALRAPSLEGQDLEGRGLDIRHGDRVPREVRDIYAKGLAYLVAQQKPAGDWSSSHGAAAGVTGICCMALLSSGEDPNFGAYAEPLRRGLRFILRAQNERTGFFSGSGGKSMYEHGFATLALAEAYGAVDDQLLQEGADGKTVPALASALELAVRCILTSQNQNPHGAWRYSPTTDDEDTSVSGACLVALFAARNAGIEVPDENVKKALDYYERSTFADGTVAYSGGMGGGTSSARTAISCLVFALGKQKDTASHRDTLKNLVDSRVMTDGFGHKYYTRYYVAQALFQGDFEAWSRWNRENTQTIRGEQKEDGCIGEDPYSTGMSLLSMALTFRFLPIYER